MAPWPGTKNLLAERAAIPGQQSGHITRHGRPRYASWHSISLTPATKKCAETTSATSCLDWREVPGLKAVPAPIGQPIELCPTYAERSICTYLSSRFTDRCEGVVRRLGGRNSRDTALFQKYRGRLFLRLADQSSRACRRFECYENCIRLYTRRGYVTLRILTNIGIWKCL